MSADAKAPDYDGDFFAWTQDQARELRALTPAQTGNRVDVAHIAAEIEDLGKRDVREVETLLMRMFEHLLKLKYLPTADARLHWLAEIGNSQTQAALAYKPSMARLLNVPRAWKLARRQALRLLAEHGVAPAIPEQCPWTQEALLADDFDLDQELAALASP